MGKSRHNRGIQAEDFYSLITVDNPQLHPDEEMAVYVTVRPEHAGTKYKRELCMIDLATKRSHRVTTGGTGGDYHPRWSPDGKRLAFISGRSGKPQVYVLPEQWGEAIQITQTVNGVNAFQWSPDGEFIAYSSRTREEERIREDQARPGKPVDQRTAKRMEEDREYDESMKSDPRVYTRTVIKQGTSFRDDRNVHIYIQKAEESAKPRRLTGGTRDFGFFSWSRDGRTIFSSTSERAPDPDIDVRSDLVSIDVVSGDITFLTDGDDADFFPHESRDGAWIYFMSFQSSDRSRQIMKLFRMPRSGGAREDVLPEYTMDPGPFQFSTDGRWLYFIVSDRGKDSLARVASNGGTPEYVLRDDCMVTGFSLGERRLVYSAEKPDMPGDLFWMKPPAAAADRLHAVRLTHLNQPLMKKRAISMPQEVWLERPDGLKIQGWYMLPHGYETGKQYPWVVQVHGGPHIMWGYSWWHEFQTMCANGYGVYFSNPRGSEGYGHEFKGAIHLCWGEKDAGDILAGADKMVEMGLADPSRLFLTGGSFGGFMTAWIVTHDHRFRAAVAQRGVYNFVSMYGASDALTLVEWEFDTLPWRNTELLWDRSPLKYVENVRTPLMILHSELDYRVGISQAEELYTALRRCGKKAEFVRFPREGHELSRSGEPRHRVDRINTIMGWFDRHLQDTD